MHTARKNTKRLVQVALLTAIICVLAITPLGYIPLGTIRATTIHIPVIIGAILLGPKVGGFLGGVFGLTSLLVNTFTPTPTSFVFTPFYRIGEVGGSLWSLVICFVPRILIGIVAGYLFRWISKVDKTQIFASIAAGLAGSIVNTILVMGGIYFLFGESYAAAKGMEYSALFSLVMTVVSVNGVLEAIVAAVLATAVAKPLLHYLGTKSAR